LPCLIADVADAAVEWSPPWADRHRRRPVREPASAPILRSPVANWPKRSNGFQVQPACTTWYWRLPEAFQQAPTLQHFRPDRQPYVSR
jgi:hypothetical protein